MELFEEEKEKTNIIDYPEIIKKYSWIIERNKKCIVSPDIDGILCGLFMSAFFNWEIVGYYDGKNLAIKKKVKPSDCVFLDMEIFSKECKSIGQHMVLYNKNDIPKNWNNFSNSINPNNIRGYDANKNFALKYPLATIHLLMCIARTKIEFSVPKTAVTVLLYVDGTFKNLLNYPENCISWLKFLNAKNESSPIAALLNIFAAQKISTMMHDLEKIFDEFRFIARGKRGGDKIKILEIKNNSFPDDLLNRTTTLINFLSKLTEWSFIKDNWTMDDLEMVNFKKGIIPIGKLNNKNYTAIMKKNPISFAITGTKQIEYTLNSSKFK
ncbi:MAG: hypothetical protein V1781_10095 [Bacteroidota bacterium]